MARIRCIKPEFPQSQSMGEVSRDARLLFVELWTLCCDHGKTRASPRMLASLLFPYDDDAPGLIEGWLGELEAQGATVFARAVDVATPGALTSFVDDAAATLGGAWQHCNAHTGHRYSPDHCPADGT